MKNLLPVLATMIICNVAVAQFKCNIKFLAVEPKFENAAEEYRKLWAAEGGKIIAKLEELSGMRLPDTTIVANVKEAPSYSGDKDEPMILRASYPTDVKKATLVHELGHRLHASLKVAPVNVNDHEILFLYLYDVYQDLYGKEFANKIVEIEGTRSNSRNDYKTMWANVLAMTRAQRETRIKEIVSKR